MGSFLVVYVNPLTGLFTYFVQCAEQVGIKNLLPEGSVEPFNKRVLHRSTRLNEVETYDFLLAPVCKCHGNEFGPIIYTNFVSVLPTASSRHWQAVPRLPELIRPRQVDRLVPHILEYEGQVGQRVDPVELAAFDERIPYRSRMTTPL